MKPNTYYTKSERINIAYQVFGSGPIDLVYIPGWVSNIDLMWRCPELVSFLEELGRHARVILFDKRGTGLSDRVVELSSLEERMDDIRAVMDAVNSEKAVLFGHSEGGSASALFAATYPARTIALITFGIFAKRRYSPDYPWAPTDEERQKVYDMIEHNWGSGKMDFSDLAPSKADDEIFMNWLANYFRSGASPSAALVLTKMNTNVDIIDILPLITVPTLILQRVNDIDVKIEEGRFIADQIQDSKIVEFDGDDHLFWAGNTAEVINEMLDFIQNLNPVHEDNPQLLTIMVAEITANQDQIGSTSLLSIDPEMVNQNLIQRCNGTLHSSEGNTFIASFEGPSKAVHCCLDFQNAIKGSNMNLKAAITIGKCVVVDNQLMENSCVEKAIKINSIAKPNQVLVSQTIKNLIPQAGLAYTLLPNSSSQELLPPIFAVTDTYSEPLTAYMTQQYSKQKNGSLLEQVLECIDENLGDEYFSIDAICRKIGIGERQLQRKLKAMTNKSPNQLIRSVRLHRAKQLLIETAQTIAEIAFETGFSNPSYFSKCFKTEFGTSPSELSQSSF